MLAFWMIIGSNKLINYLLKDKIDKKLMDLLDIVSIIPMVPVFWAWRKSVIININKDFTFYIALFFSVAFFLVLIRKTYLYNKEE